MSFFVNVIYCMSDQSFLGPIDGKCRSAIAPIVSDKVYSFSQLSLSEKSESLIESSKDTSLLAKTIAEAASSLCWHIRKLVSSIQFITFDFHQQNTNDIIKVIKHNITSCILLPWQPLHNFHCFIHNCIITIKSSHPPFKFQFSLIP